MNNGGCQEIGGNYTLLLVRLRPVRLRAQESELFNSIFVIAEAPRTWNIERAPRVYRDPLVVGWVDETDQMFLITRFNATDLEKYVEEQFVK
jgi:hypothetical protein